MLERDEEAIREAGRAWPQRLALGTSDVDDPRWRRAVDPDDAGLFARRLAWQQALAVDGSARDWLAELHRLRAALRHGSAPDPALEAVPFGALIAPVVADVWGRLIARSPGVAHWSPTAQWALRADLGARIAEVTADAFYRQFTANRPQGAAIMARLGWARGTNDRYRRWCREQASDGLTSILRAYPVLGRLLAITTLNWASGTADMIDRVGREHGRLALHFGIAEDEHVVGIAPGLSDPHRGGHRVAIIEFAHGTRIVYKPRDLRVEHWFAGVTEYVNTHFGDAALHPITVLPGDGDYGFTSVAEHRPCPPTRLPDFYVAAGRLCALLYLLGATDAHYENVIACGSQLALIDSETLFHVDLEQAQCWSDTVLRTGMLPAWTLSGSGHVSDPSALGAEAPPEITAQGWVNLNTDDMARAEVTRRQPPPLSSPAQPNPLPDHVDDLVRGFREVYLDAQIREHLLTELANLRGLPQRVVLRDTRVYSLVQRQATRAEALAEGQARGVVLEQLSRAALVSGERGPLMDAFAAELDEMENLDIPYFRHALGSPDVQGVRGTIAGLVSQDPLADAAHRLRTTEDAGWQEHLIRGSVRARFLVADEPPAPRGQVADLTAAPVPTVASVLSQIDGARTDGTWLALFRLPDGHCVRLGMIGDGWYDGRAGLAEVQRQLGGPWQETLEPLRSMLEQPDAYTRFRFLRNLGLGFSGVGGLLRNTGVADRVLAVLPSELIVRDQVLDFVGGVAGLIGPLATSDGTLLELAASHLAAAQLPAGGWASTISSKPLTGLAHGAAGMGLALLQAGAATGRQEWIDAGARAFAYENSLFEAGNWPDLRRPGDPPMVAWCHGAPGIGLARMLALRLLPDHPDADRWNEDLVCAMHTTATAALPATDHLCCGLSGRAAVLRICGRAMGEPRWVTAAKDLTDAVIAGYQRRGAFVLPLDEPQGPVSPGLMTGLAGIAAHLGSLDTDTDLLAFVS